MAKVDAYCLWEISKIVLSYKDTAGDLEQWVELSFEEASSLLDRLSESVETYKTMDKSAEDFFGEKENKQ